MNIELMRAPHPVGEAGSPRRATRGRWRALGVLGICSLLLASSCTVRSGSQYQADIQPWGTIYVHIYRYPSWQLLVYDRLFCKRNATCTIAKLNEVVNAAGGVPWPVSKFWNDANKRKDKFAEALNVIEASGITRGVGTNRCMTMYSVWTSGWTTSVGSPCKPGTPA